MPSFYYKKTKQFCYGWLVKKNTNDNPETVKRMLWFVSNLFCFATFCLWIVLLDFSMNFYLLQQKEGMTYVK